MLGDSELQSVQEVTESCRSAHDPDRQGRHTSGTISKRR